MLHISLPRLTSLLVCSACAAVMFMGSSTCAQVAATPDERPYVEQALRRGDPAAGKRLFAEHAVLRCAQCHGVAAMEKSGPDLDGAGDKYTTEELIVHLLHPSREIAPGWEQVTVVTKDGRTFVGRIERANQSIVRLIDAEGNQRDVPAAEVEEMQRSSVSLMPDNLIGQISPQEFADVVSYLATLKYQTHRGFIAAGRPIDIPRATRPVEFRPIHPPELAFENPVWCGALPGAADQLAVVEHQTARIWRLMLDDSRPRKELFLDLASDTYFSGNQGLMCVAFHPRFSENGRYFLEHEVEEEGIVKTTIVERRAAADGLSDSGRPSIRLLEVVQPAYNHNGGCIAFGPDGMLYAAFGDGGPQRDPNGYAQNPRELLGSMVRIDVDRTEGDRPYATPRDNPFWGRHRRDPAIRPETWAIGFREPWRFSFDFATGELYVGDVGQDKFEEVSLVRRGDNHGWNVREAFAPFSDEYLRPDETFVEPIFAYEHGLGFSVTGGHVYRGTRNESFQGVYVFGDYNTRRVWGLRQRDGVVRSVQEIGTAPGGVVSFGLGADGEIYLTTYRGTIYHVDLAQARFD